MQVVLISPHGSIIAYGLRTLAACLKRAGHSVRMIFLPDPREIEPIPGLRPAIRYSETQLDQASALCRDAGLIGITCSTLHVPRVSRLTARLKRDIGAPVVWGGIHPSIDPAACLDHADWVCVGEGETALVELAGRLQQGEDVRDVPNLAWLEGDGNIRRNPLNPLIRDLDALPFPDYRHEDHFILHGGRIIPMTPSLAAWYLTDGYTFGNGSAYHIWSSRGCPHSCAFCGNSVYQSLYADWSRVRRMSPGRIADEIDAKRREMPFITETAFMDDTFFSASDAAIEEFAEVYAARIGLPFFACASPATLSRRKMDALVAAGLRYIWMGIQSGSPRIQALYRRNDRPDGIRAAARLLHDYRDRIRPPVYDVIIDTVFQEPADQRETIRLLLDLPRPFQPAVYSMTFFPGTEITRRALEEKRIKPDRLDPEKSLVSLEPIYYRILLWMAGRSIPRWLLRILNGRASWRILGGPVFAPLWRRIGARLDRREAKALVRWTVDHRTRIVRRHFPAESVSPLCDPFTAALVPGAKAP